MGLDRVELLLATEETFGIEITDEEAQNAGTPAKLLEVVMRKIEAAEEAPCLTQQAFYLFRRRCVQVLGIKRNAIRPNTSLSELIPKHDRPLKWEQLKCAVGARRWPDLSRSRYLKTAILFLAGAAFLIPAMYVKTFDSLAWMGCALAASITAWLCLASTRRMKWNYAPEMVTAADVAEFLASRQSRLLRQTPPKPWNRETVWPILRNLITEQSGLKEFDENSRFLEDLGID